MTRTKRARLGDDAPDAAPMVASADAFDISMNPPRLRPVVAYEHNMNMILDSAQTTWIFRYLIERDLYCDVRSSDWIELAREFNLVFLTSYTHKLLRHHAIRVILPIFGRKIASYSHNRPADTSHNYFDAVVAIYYIGTVLHGAIKEGSFHVVDTCRAMFPEPVFELHLETGFIPPTRRALAAEGDSTKLLTPSVDASFNTPVSATPVPSTAAVALHLAMWGTIPSELVKQQTIPVRGKLVLPKSEGFRAISTAVKLAKRLASESWPTQPVLSPPSITNAGVAVLSGPPAVREGLLDAVFLPEWFMMNRDRYGDLAPYLQEKLDILASGKNPFPDFLFSQDWCRDVDVADNRSIKAFSPRSSETLLTPAGPWVDVCLQQASADRRLREGRGPKDCFNLSAEVAPVDVVMYPHPHSYIDPYPDALARDREAPLPGIWSSPSLAASGYADPMWTNAAWPFSCPPPFPGHQVPGPGPKGKAKAKDGDGAWFSGSIATGGLSREDIPESAVAVAGLLQEALERYQARLAAACVSPSLVRHTRFILQQKIALYMLRRSLRHVYLTVARSSASNLLTASTLLAAAASLTDIMHSPSPNLVAASLLATHRMHAPTPINTPAKFNSSIFPRLAGLALSLAGPRRLLCGWMRSDALRVLNRVAMHIGGAPVALQRLLPGVMQPLASASMAGRDSEDLFKLLFAGMVGHEQTRAPPVHMHMSDVEFDMEGSDDDDGLDYLVINRMGWNRSRWH